MVVLPYKHNTALNYCSLFVGVQVNVGSLENVIRGYLKSAEERTEAAREQSQQAVIDIDDLDNLTTPESILLRYVQFVIFTTNQQVYFI